MSCKEEILKVQESLHVLKIELAGEKIGPVEQRTLADSRGEKESSYLEEGAG